MANTTKIVFVGAGSMQFGISMYRDLFSRRDLAGSTLMLVDTNAEALERMTKLARFVNGRMGAGMIIESSTDRQRALDGAGFVVNATAIDRFRLWRQDFEVPKKYGIRHTLGENGGPGGLFFTLRTLPLVFDIARDMAEICPKALFINYSNPESRIILALGKYTKVPCLGLCHGIFMAQHDVARILGRPGEEVEVWGAGLNHFQWLMEVRERATGRDLYPELRAKEPAYDKDFAPLTRRMFRSFDRWVSCSDDHMGEYLPYGYEAGEHGYDFDGDARGRQGLVTEIDEVIAEKRPLPPDWQKPSGERGVVALAAILHNKRQFIESGVVYNRGAIPNLPADLAVEVPIVADAAGIHPVSLGPLPEPIAKLLTVQAGVQQMAVEAAVHASKELALQALLIDPVVNSTDAAVKILDELWEINKPYIRKCL
ncbi:MAG: alpha-glucosidase/alpha-galactosidase [Rhodospirillales bacterium]|nr:alpha-glucosidase/alpha-galactosidase [Rhodospirillales bacterium]